MSTLKIELELPEEILEYLGTQKIDKSIKELIVLNLLREHKISQGRASELLGINRWKLIELMKSHSIPVVDLSNEELKEEIRIAGEIFGG
jgi:predicted HTH domain antitoxin